MANRAKEDEKYERVIRGLLKLPENRRCINCNSLGPQYVCTNFWAFVCTTCSGIHREFTHRVKSVSMAKFTSQEVSALQGGGNARAKEIYFKEWDSQRVSVPDSSNVERLREFIKHVYVDRRYTCERNFDKIPRVKIGETEDSYENRRIDAYQGGSRSPRFEDTCDRRYSDRPSPGGRSDEKNYRSSYDERSPGYDQQNSENRSSGCSEIVNDWRREDRLGNVRRSDEFRISDSKLDGRSPDHQKDIDMSNPPIVRPVRDILRDTASPFPIIDPPKANGGRGAEGSACTQTTASSSSLASSNGNPAELKRENSGILIDFDSFTEPPVNEAVPQTQQTATDLQPTSSNADNWACFDSFTEVKEPQAPTNANPLESVLSQLSVPASVPFTSSSLVSHLGYVSVSPFGSAAPSAATTNNFTTIPPHVAPAVVPVGHTSISSFGVGAPPVAPATTTFPPAAALGSASALTVNGANSPVKVGDRGHWPGIYPQQHSLFHATGSQPTAQSFAPHFSGASSNQPWNSLFTTNTLESSSITAAPVSQAVSEVAMGVVIQPSLVEVRPSGMKELPQDLFAATYSHVPAPVPGRQIGPSHGLGFTMPYNAVLSMPTIPQLSKSTNPFDLNNESLPVQAPMFLSMASLQSALPNMAASSGLLRTSSPNTPSSTWMPPQSSFPSAMPPRAPSHALMISPSAYMGQQVPSNLPLRQQGVVGFGSEGASFGSLSSNQHLGGIYSAPATQNTFSSVGGNPFG